MNENCGACVSYGPRADGSAAVWSGCSDIAFRVSDVVFYMKLDFVNLVNVKPFRNTLMFSLPYLHVSHNTGYSATCVACVWYLVRVSRFLLLLVQCVPCIWY